MRRTKYPCVQRGDFLELTAAGHDIWMKENNPDGWDSDTWRAFASRCSLVPAFKERCQQAKRAGLPRPHPTEDGWTAPRMGPLEAVSRGLRIVK